MNSWQWFCAVMTGIAFLGTIGLVLVLRPTMAWRQQQEADDNARQTQVGGRHERESELMLPWEQDEETR